MKFTGPWIIVLGVLLGAGVLAQETEPEPPINLSASGDYEGAVAVATLKWQDESTNELGFEILRSDNNEGFRVVGFVGANTTRYQDKIGKYITGAFIYQVRAFNQQGKSAESNAASVWF